MRYILFLILIFAVSCSDNNPLLSRLYHIDSIMDANPQAAYDSLCAIKNTQNIAPAKNVDMKWRMLMATAQNKLYMQMPTDSTFSEVVAYYDRNGSDNEKMQSRYLLGCIYRDMNDAPKAIECYNYVLEHFSDIDSQEGYKLLALSYGEKADLLYAQLLLPKAIAAYNNAILYSEKCNDSLLLANNYNYKSFAYSLLNMYDSAIVANETSTKILLALNRKTDAAIVYGCNMINYLNKKDFVNLKNAVDMYEFNSGLFHDGEIEKGKEIFYYFKASYYLNVNNLDSASYYFYKDLSLCSDYNNKHAATEGLAQVYTLINNKDSIAKYTTLASAWNDSLYLNKNTELSAKNEALYSYNSYKRSAAKSMHENQTTKFSYRIVLVLIVILILLGIFFIRKKTQKVWWRHNQLLTKMKKYRDESKSIADNKILENNKLKTINQNLVNEKSAIESEKNDLQKKLDEYKENEELLKSIPTINEVDKLILESSVYGVIYNYLQKRKSINEGILAKLFEMMDTILPSFRTKMMSVEPLAQLDYAICILVRLHFRPADICTLLDIDSATLSMKRKRLLKKVYGMDGSAKDFDQRVLKIY